MPKPKPESKPRVSLTVVRVKAFTAEGAKFNQAFLWDLDVPGFAVRATVDGSKSYIFERRLHGKTVRMTIGPVHAWDLPEARARARELQRMIDKGIHPRAEEAAQKAAQERKGLTVSKAWERFEPVAEEESNDFATVKSRATHIVEHLGDVLFSDLTRLHTDAYRRARTAEKASIATVNREIAFLRHLGYYLLECKLIDANPMAKPAFLPEDNIRSVVLSETDFTALYQAAEPALKPIILVAYDTGMRKGEILNLRWNQVDLKRGTIELEGTDTKTRKARTIILTARVKAALKAMPRSISGFVFVNSETDKPWVQIKKVFFRARDAAKLEKIWFHDLRRSFVTKARRAGVPETVIMEMSGHKTRSVFARYNIVDDSDRREAVRQIERAQRQK